MSIWGLPLPLVRAVAFHHCPAEAGETEFSSLTAVHAADALTSADAVSPLHRDAALDLTYIEQLGLNEKAIQWAQLSPKPCGAKTQAETEADTVSSQSKSASAGSA